MLAACIDILWLCASFASKIIFYQALSQSLAPCWGWACSHHPQISCPLFPNPRGQKLLNYVNSLRFLFPLSCTWAATLNYLGGFQLCFFVASMCTLKMLPNATNVNLSFFIRLLSSRSMKTNWLTLEEAQYVHLFICAPFFFQIC